MTCLFTFALSGLLREDYFLFGPKPFTILNPRMRCDMSHRSSRKAPVFLAAVAALSLSLLGCDDSHNDFDHDIPPGKGTIFVDNNSPNGVEVFIDGVDQGKVGNGNADPFDLDPGTHRVVLNQHSSDRAWNDFVDVLVGKKTILDVTNDPNDYNALDVYVYFKN